MNYTTDRSNDVTTASQKMRASTHCLRGRSAGGAPLTSYKQVADISDKGYYGLSSHDLNQVTEKLKNQKNFLEHSYLFDRINNRYIPLADLVISAYHAPQRYYGETQNKVNTLQQFAKERDLVPLFMTITLPSEFHPKKMKNGKLVRNKNYRGHTPKDGSLALTKKLKRLRDDRSYKELKKSERLFIKVIEPHQDGTPHLHMLLYVPADRVERIKKAFKRLYTAKGNDIQDGIRNSVAYVMKYINKVLPLSKKDKLTAKEKYLNAWYSKHQIIRFSSSRTLAPLYLYRLLHNRFSMYALTKLYNEKEFKIYVALDSDKVMEIIDSFGETLYTHSDNYDLLPLGSYVSNSQTSESAIGMVS